MRNVKWSMMSGIAYLDVCLCCQSNVDIDIKYRLLKFIEMHHKIPRQDLES